MNGSEVILVVSENIGNIIHILRHCGPQRDVEDSQARAHAEEEGSSGGDQPWHQQA